MESEPLDVFESGEPFGLSEPVTRERRVDPVGTWSYSPPTVTLRYAIGIVDTGTVGSGLLTIIRNGFTWVYERR